MEKSDRWMMAILLSFIALKVSDSIWELVALLAIMAVALWFTLSKETDSK